MTTRETTDVDDVDVSIEEGRQSLGERIRSAWHLWAIAVVAAAGTAFALSAEITGPVDEFLFAALAVAVAVVALARTATGTSHV